MKSLFNIFNKSIVREYYRQNMVFIFVVILFSFGFLRAVEHITIIKLILKFPALLMMTFLAWGIYSIKAIFFMLRLLGSRPYEFLYHARLFPGLKRWLVFCALMFNLLLLTILYAVFMIKIGIDEGRYVAVVLIVAFNFLLIVSGAFILSYRVQRPNPEKIIAGSIEGIFSKFRTPPYLFFVRYLSSRQPVLLIITKLFSLVILTGFCYLYPTDDYDGRFLSISALVVAASHIVFSQHFFQFEHLQLSFTRNLPLSFVRRFVGYLLTYGLLLVPEILVLIKNLPEGVSYFFALQLLVFILSIVLFNHHLLYVNTISPDSFTKMLFFGGIGLLLLIMFKIPVLLLSAIFICTSILIFRKYFYLSEYNEE